VGLNLTYTIDGSNLMQTDATNVVLTDVLPASVSLVSANATQGSCSGTTTVTCNLGTVAQASPVTVTIVVTPTSDGTISNTASVSLTETDPNQADNHDTETTNVFIPPAIRLLCRPLLCLPEQQAQHTTRPSRQPEDPLRIT